jgi:ankyrin repeat protein
MRYFTALFLSAFLMLLVANNFLATATSVENDLAQKKQSQVRAPLLDAASKGDMERVKSLLTSGVDVNMKGLANETALMLAVFERHPAIVDILLKAGANVNMESVMGWTPLMWAVNSSSLEIQRRLLQADAYINARSSKNGRTALIFASIGNNSQTVKTRRRLKACRTSRLRR